MTDRIPKTTPGNFSHDPRYFYWRLLLTASLIAAAVSLLTTGFGLARYISLPLAWSLALAVQLGLFGLAWLVGTGGEARRWWISALYGLTMLFSVTFSYVTLQSEFTEEIRPAEARRQLFDVARNQLAETSRSIETGVQQSADLRLRLTSWLEMERRDGWATRTCEQEDHCYLESVCDRIRRRIGQWEDESGQTYREGPGEKLIFGTLQTELEALEQLEGRLTDYRAQLVNGDGVLDPELPNQERLVRLDRVINQAPYGDLEAVTCAASTPPNLTAFSDHARDHASGNEQPVYAFQDLLRIFRSDHVHGPEDYPTLFALALAFFIDLFVLVVALGASTIEWGASTDRRRLDGVPGSFEEALQQDIARWIDASLLAPGTDLGTRQGFLNTLLGAISFSGEGEAQLIPETEEQKRFGHLLVQSKAARVERFVQFNRMGRLFLLEDWVYPALARHLTIPAR